MNIKRAKEQKAGKKYYCEFCKDMILPRQAVYKKTRNGVVLAFDTRECEEAHEKLGDKVL